MNVPQSFQTTWGGIAGVAGPPVWREHDSSPQCRVETPRREVIPLEHPPLNPPSPFETPPIGTPPLIFTFNFPPPPLLEVSRGSPGGVLGCLKGAPRRVGPRRVGGPEGWGVQISRFFSLSHLPENSFFSSLTGGLLEEFWAVRAPARSGERERPPTPERGPPTPVGPPTPAGPNSS